MALFKEITSDNGIVSKYHKVSYVSLCESEITCHLASYANKEYRDNGQSAVGNDVYFFTCSVEEEESMGIRKLCYKKLKELDMWKDAENC